MSGLFQPGMQATTWGKRQKLPPGYRTHSGLEQPTHVQCHSARLVPIRGPSCGRGERSEQEFPHSVGGVPRDPARTRPVAERPPTTSAGGRTPARRRRSPSPSRATTEYGPNGHGAARVAVSAHRPRVVSGPEWARTCRAVVSMSHRPQESLTISTGVSEGSVLSRNSSRWVPVGSRTLAHRSATGPRPDSNPCADSPTTSTLRVPPPYQAAGPAPGTPRAGRTGWRRGAVCSRASGGGGAGGRSGRPRGGRTRRRRRTRTGGPARGSSGAAGGRTGPEPACGGGVRWGRPRARSSASMRSKSTSTGRS